jgi:hypothetical protein
MKSSSDASNQWFISLFATSVERQRYYQMSETERHRKVTSITAPYGKRGGPSTRPPRMANDPAYAATGTLWEVEVTASNV